MDNLDKERELKFLKLVGEFQFLPKILQGIKTHVASDNIKRNTYNKIKEEEVSKDDVGTILMNFSQAVDRKIQDYGNRIIEKLQENKMLDEKEKQIIMTKADVDFILMNFSREIDKKIDDSRQNIIDALKKDITQEIDNYMSEYNVIEETENHASAILSSQADNYIDNNIIKESIYNDFNNSKIDSYIDNSIIEELASNDFDNNKVDSYIEENNIIEEYAEINNDKVVDVDKNDVITEDCFCDEKKCENTPRRFSQKERRLLVHILRDIKTLKQYYIYLTKITFNRYYRYTLHNLANQLGRAIFILSRILRKYNLTLNDNCFEFEQPRSFCYGVEVANANCAKILDNVLYFSNTITDLSLSRNLSMISVMLTSQLVFLKDISK